MENRTKDDLPFSARYALPLHVSENLGEVSWDAVAQLSTDFQIKCDEKGARVRKVVKELQLSRMVLMDRIRHGCRGGGIEPKLLVEITRLLQRCERMAEQYNLDLKEFSTFLHMVSEKLKKEKLARYHGSKVLKSLAPIEEELTRFKEKSEPAETGRKKSGRRNGR